MQGGNVNLFLGLEGVHIAGDIEIEVVLSNLFGAGPVRVFLYDRACPEGLYHFSDMRLVHDVLRLAGCKLLASVDEEYVLADLILATLLARAVENENSDRDAGRSEQVGGQADHGVEQIFFYERLPDAPLGGAAKEHAVGDDHRHPSAVALGNLDHVGDEAVVALGLGRHAAPEALVLVLGRVFRTPLVQRKGRVGNYDVKLHQMIALNQGRAVQGVAPLDARRVLGVQKHIHAGQCPGRAVHLLAVQGEVVRADLLGGTDQQRTRATGRVADGIAGLRSGQAGQQPGDRGGSVKLPGLFAGVRGKTRDEIDIALADNVLVHPRRTQIEGGLGEVFQKILEAAIAVLDPTEISLRVEVDVAEHAFELGAVGVLDLLKRDVDEFADIGLVAPLMQFVEARPLGQDETLALQPAADARLVVAVPGAVGFDVVVPQVRNILQEQHHQDVVLVLTGINDAPKGVTGGPSGLVDLLLSELVGHFVPPSRSVPV